MSVEQMARMSISWDDSIQTPVPSAIRALNAATRSEPFIGNLENLQRLPQRETVAEGG